MDEPLTTRGTRKGDFYNYECMGSGCASYGDGNGSGAGHNLYGDGGKGDIGGDGTGNGDGYGKARSRAEMRRTNETFREFDAEGIGASDPFVRDP